MSEPVLLLGGAGSIGTRYQAILKSIKVPYLVYDAEQEDGFSCNGEKNLSNISFDKAIICTPTDTHMNYVSQLIHLGKTFLCEKPLAKTEDELQTKEDYPFGFVVCNYKFITKAYGMNPKLTYDYYKTGQDGLLFDCCQIIYLDPECELDNQSPLWDFTVNGHPIPYRSLELSYVQMIKSFIWNHGKECWTLRDGVAMSRAVLERMKK
jgi:Oxidoreductase family, NAD-binding Rossmann fold